MSAPQLRQNNETELEDADASRRDSPRAPARDLADIMPDRSKYAVACMIRNISGTGAMIESASRDVPDRFVLVNHVRKFKSVCRVVWRRGPLMGVRFLTPPREFGQASSD